MIGYFPDPYPDELLYSVCARFHARTKFPNVKSTLRKLFGESASIASVDLPSHLNHLVSVLPPNNCYTVESLINDHTLLPFYSPFCSPERVACIMEEMQKDKGYPHERLAISIVSQRQKEWLQFCPLCVQEDRKQFGECYWHRLHQIFGIEICPIHEVFLENSDVPVRRRAKTCEFISAEQRIQPILEKPINFSNNDHLALLRIAHDAAWLMSQHELVPGLVSFRNRYIRLLADKGLASYTGYIHSRRLISYMKDLYSPYLLKLLQFEINEQSKTPWPSSLVTNPYDVHHPLQHLLVIQVLGLTADEFFQLPQDFKFFGDSPWPCLNPICEYFQQLKIETYQVNYTSTKSGLKPIGKFECQCGFIYSRIGPDISLEDRFRFTKVNSYGFKWNNILKILWEDPNYSLSTIADRLKVASTTVKRQAVLLGLTFPRQGPRTVEINQNLANKWINSFAKTQNKLEENRKQWLSIIDANPNLGRRDLQRRFATIHLWLKNHDPEWLEINLPECQKITRKEQKSTVDWESLDIEISNKIQASAERIRNAYERPVRITKALLGRDIGKASQIRNNINKLPLTAQILDKITETYEECAIRKINWAAESFRKEKISPARSQLIVLSGVYKLKDIPEVNDAINAALQSLELLSSADRWHRGSVKSIRDWMTKYKLTD
ncbi:TniQ family protein [Calothrix sp. FACHB-156]|nr:TniQ family protein [Calothrix sp. FACHB-156]